MTLRHAVIWTDHHSAQVLQFDDEQVVSRAVRSHKHPTGQHGSDVRTQHEFFAELCNALDGLGETLVTGSHTVLADLRHYLQKHRPQTAEHVVGYDIVDHLTEKQLVAHGRTFFAERTRLGQSPAP